ncbi:MAG: SH3 domain-containing protein [Elainellaceae cyanobacterium]
MFVPVAVAFIGNRYTEVVKNREVEGQFVALAVGILQEEPTGEQEDPLRAWAVDVIGEYSGVSIEEARDALIQREALPTRLGIVSTPGNLPVNVRSGPGVAAAIIGRLPSDAQFEWDETSAVTAGGYTWVRLTTGEFAGGWIAKDYLGDLGQANPAQN